MTPASAVPPTWSPILEGEAAARATAAVDAIAEAIREGPLPARNAGPTLAGGEAGFALLFEYLDRARPGRAYDEVAQQRLGQAIDALSASIQMPGLYSGFTGVSWVVEHLTGGSADAEDEEDPNQDIDTALLSHLRQTPWMQDYDLVSGLVGFGVYALERLPRPSAAACLELVVERLAEIAQPRPEGLAWHTPFHLIPEPNKPWYTTGYDNLGVAHGTPGVVGLLARVCASGVAAERALPLLQGSVSWLLAQKLSEGEISVFPYSRGTDRVRPARTGWCYGDPGIAATLLAAGRSVGEPDWEREAIELARTVARRPVADCGVNDAGLCHGAAGLGHLLNRLYHATGDPELLEAARGWFDRTLAYQEAGHGIGGFLAFSPLDGDFDTLVWNEDAAFLGGSTGIALALLAATSGVDPAWDRVLLLSPLPETSAL